MYNFGLVPPPCNEWLLHVFFGKGSYIDKLLKCVLKAQKFTQKKRKTQIAAIQVKNFLLRAYEMHFIIEKYMSHLGVGNGKEST